VEFIVTKLDASHVYPGVFSPSKCAGANDLFPLSESICNIQKDNIKSTAVLKGGGHNNIKFTNYAVCCYGCDNDRERGVFSY
jgi:hypothetical protein